MEQTSSVSNKRGTSTLRTYVSLFLILLLCAVIASFVASQITNRHFYAVQRENTFSAARTTLQNVDTALDSTLEGTLITGLKIIDSVLDNPVVKDSPFAQSVTYSLRNVVSTSPYIEFISIIDGSRNRVYDSTHRSNTLYAYPDQALLTLIEKNRDTGAPQLDVLHMYYRSITKEESSGILGTNSSPFDCLTVLLSRKDDSHVAVNVNLNNFLSHLSRSSVSGGLGGITPRYLIVTNDGTAICAPDFLISEHDIAEKLSKLSFDSQNYSQIALDETYHVIRLYNYDYELTYYTLISDKEITTASQTSLVSLQSAQIGLFMMLILVFSLLFLSFMHPITKLLRSILDQDPAADVPDGSAVFSVNEMLQSIVRRSKELRDEAESARPVYQATLLSDLMLDRPLSADPVLFTRTLETLRQYGMVLDADGTWQCGLVSLYYDEGSSFDADYTVKYIAEQIEARFEHPNQGFTVELGQDLIGIALCVARKDSLLSLLHAVQKDILVPLKAETVISVGVSVDGLSHLRQSYDTAFDAQSYRRSFDADEIIEAEHLHIRSGILESYWQKEENGLLSHILTGDVENAQKTLAAFFAFIEENRYAIPYREVADMTLALGRVVIAAIEQSKSVRKDSGQVAQSPSYTLFHEFSAPSSRSALAERYQRLVTSAACEVRITSDDAAGSTRKRHELTIARICSYVDEHYADDLSLGTISTIFGYTASYLSTIFRDITGIGFPQYLENRRMEAAARLLKSGNLRIAQIAEMTGYRSASYFITAFRKKYGVSPETWRTGADK